MCLWKQSTRSDLNWKGSCHICTYFIGKYLETIIFSNEPIKPSFCDLTSLYIYDFKLSPLGEIQAWLQTNYILLGSMFWNKAVKWYHTCNWQFLNQKWLNSLYKGICKQYIFWISVTKTIIWDPRWYFRNWTLALISLISGKRI